MLKTILLNRTRQFEIGNPLKAQASLVMIHNKSRVTLFLPLTSSRFFCSPSGPDAISCSFPDLHYRKAVEIHCDSTASVTSGE